MAIDLTESTIYEARGRTVSDVPPDTEAWMVTHNDGSDYGRASLIFAREDEARAYAERTREAGPQGNYFHPPPDSLNLRVFHIYRLDEEPDWPESSSPDREGATDA